MKKCEFKGTAEERKDQFIDYAKDYKPGTIAKICYCSHPKTKAAFKDSVITKTTEALVRMGIEYSNTQAFQSLERELVSLPDSQKRLDGYGKYLQVTENENGEILAYKVRLFTVNGAKSHSEYTIDGKPTTYEELVEMGAISPKKVSANPLIMFTVFIDNLQWLSIAD